MKDVTVAHRYAQALFLVTEKRRVTAAVLEDLKGLHAVLAPGGRVASFLMAPQMRLADKRKALAAALDNRAQRVVVSLLDLLMRKSRLPLLGEIRDAFEALVERAQGIRRAHVVSAVALNEHERTRLIAVLEGYTKASIRLTAEVDAAVMGGAMVRIGDRVVDRTVRTLLQSVAAKLHEVSV